MGIEGADNFSDGPSSEIWGITAIPLALGGSSWPDPIVKDLLLKM